MASHHKQLIKTKELFEKKVIPPINKGLLSMDKAIIKTSKAAKETVKNAPEYLEGQWRRSPIETTIIGLLIVALFMIITIPIYMLTLLDRQVRLPNEADTFQYQVTIQTEEDGTLVGFSNMRNEYAKGNKVIYGYKVHELNINDGLNQALLDKEITPIEARLEIPQLKMKNVTIIADYDTVKVERDDAGNVVSVEVLNTDTKTFEFEKLSEEKS